MRPKTKSTPNGVITFHTPFPVNLLKSEFQDSAADLKSPAESRRSPSQPRAPFGRMKVRKSDETSPSEQQLSSRQSCLSNTSHRQLQARMDAENQQLTKMTQPLLEAGNDFLKELERFFNQRDVTELRRRELLHKRWTERVWLPLQRSVERRVSKCGPVEAKRRQSLFSHYLHHCNSKGFVFLETYDLKEYNPFLLNIKQPRYFKLSSADFKDPFYLQLHERLKDQRTACCEAGFKYKLPQSEHPQHASPHYQSSTSRKTTVESVTPGRSFRKPETVPFHISASSTLDGRCNRPDCWFSRCRQQPASLQQPWSTLKNKVE